MPCTCLVVLDGRPLPGATVTFKLEPFLDEKMPAATGITDIEGKTKIVAAPESIPEKLRGTQLVPPGLYKVLITHPQRPYRAAITRKPS